MMHFFILIIFFSMNLFAGTGQKIVDEWVLAAVKTPSEYLVGSGNWQCEHAIQLEENYVTNGTSLEIAQNLNVLQCMKSHCHQISDQIKKTYSTLYQMNENDFLDFTESLGISEEVRQDLLRAKNQNKTIDTSNMNCITGSPLVRQNVFRNCFAMPLRCRSI
jgi:hypothetical protein